MTPTQFIRAFWNERHRNPIYHVAMWEAIGAERRHRARQAKRYPLDRRWY